MNMKKLLSIALVLSMSATFADGKGPSWDYLGLGYLDAEIDGIDGFSPAGFEISGSRLINEHVFIYGSYSDLSDDFNGVDVDLSEQYFGLGYRFMVSDTTDFAIAAGYAAAEICAPFAGCLDDNGYSVSALLNSRVTNNVELYGGLTYVDIADESDTGVTVGINYFVSNEFSVGFEYGDGNDLEAFGINAKFHF